MERVILTDNLTFAIVDKLIRNKTFLIHTAEACNSAYLNSTCSQQSPLFSYVERELLLKEDNYPIRTSNGMKKLATNLAGFYAMQEAVFAFSNENRCDPLDVIKNIASDTPDTKILNLAQRFAHATWLTSNSHRSGFTRKMVMPYDMLSDNDKFLDTVQIVTSAKILLSAINDELKLENQIQ